MHASRAGQVMVRLRDGRVLVAGGETAGDFYCRSSVEIYDPSRNAWTKAARLAHRECGARALVLGDGRVLVAGGYLTKARGTSGPTATVEVYDPTTDRWSVAPSMHDPRAYATIAALPNGDVLLAGGGTRSAERYNPRTGRWWMTGPMSIRRSFFGSTEAATLPDGDVLVAGGSRYRAERYVVAQHRWRPAGHLRTKGDPYLFPLPNGHVLAIGAGHTAKVDEYLPAKNDWRPFVALPQQREAVQVVAVRGRPLVLGGFGRTDPRGSIPAHATGWLWSPTRDRWLVLTTMPAPKADFGAVRLRDGTILVAGGQTLLEQGAHVPTRSAFRYDLR